VSTKVEEFLTALLTPFQALEDGIQQCIVGRRIDTAVGVQLDELGKLVGRPREGITDDEMYRRFVRAQIATNNSDGRTEDLITITRLVVYDDAATYRVRNYGAACVHVQILNVAVEWELAARLIRLLRAAVSAGVRVVLEFSLSADALMFGCEDSDGLGYDDSTTPGSGGAYACAIE
jgi:hypothetical protein